MSHPQPHFEESAAAAAAAAFSLLALQRDEFDSILTGVSIDEDTFEITLENNETSSVEKLQVIISDLRALKRRIAVTEYVFRESVSNKIDFIRDVRDDMLCGNYFTSIENLWTSEAVPFATADTTLFNRTYEITCRQVHEGYRKTVDGAIKTCNAVTDGAGRSNDSQSSSQSESGPLQLDVFGVNQANTESAYLLPRSPDCASLWYHFVPYVLCSLEVTNVNDEGETTTIFTPDMAQWNYFQKCIHGFAVRKRRANGEGIKHFRTNRIQLRDQKYYLGKQYCLLIIPVLNIDEVKNWNGSGYSAIVVAGQYKVESVKIVLPSTVYKRIEAHEGCVTFANEEECSTARLLLETMVLCVCKSSRDTLTDQFRRDTLDKKYYQEKNKNSSTDVKSDAATAPVPKSSRVWNNTNRVRKVTFAASNHLNMNPAPDPVLLLGKAASNWLKRQGLFVLPGCNDDDDNDNSSCCSSSSFVASRRQDEKDIQGWSTKNALEEQLPGMSIVEVSCLPRETGDELLSDIDEE